MPKSHDLLLNDKKRISHLAKEAVKAYSRSMQIRLIEHSVSIGHRLFLRALWEKDGQTQRELAANVGVMEPTAYSALRALKKLGYITRMKKEGDRKQVYIYLTEEGKELKDVLMPLAEDVSRKALSGVPAEDVEATQRTLAAIIKNLQKDEVELVNDERRVPSTRDVSRVIESRHRAGERGAMARSRSAKAR